MIKNFLLLLILFSCVSHPNREYSNPQNIQIQCSLKNQKEIYISFLNNDVFPIKVNKPCIFNAYVDIHKEGKPLNCKIRVKANPECMYPIQTLENNESREFKYSYYLNNLFDLKEGENYTMFIEYYVYENNRLKQKIISEGYDFIWNKQ